MRAAHGRPFESLRVDGGGARNALLLELQAALLGAPVLPATNPETTASGAARLALVGAGHAARPEDLQPWSDDHHPVAPLPLPDRDHRLARWTEAVRRSRGWAGV